VPVTGRSCGVLGRPIGHSLSPALHRAGYRELGLDWRYEAYDVGPEELPGFLDGLDGSWRGLSLTMPLKRAVLPLLDGLDDRARQAGAANTVLLEPGRRTGANTDVPGAAAAVRERYSGPVTRALVLGGGATAASVLLALADLGCREARLLVRSPQRAAVTVEAVSRHPAPPALEVGALSEPRPPQDLEIVVSTVPASAQTIELAAFADVAPVAFDVGYDPWPTAFAARAQRAGRVLVSGLDLLVHQAALQLTLMTGLDAPLATMRAAGEQALTDLRTP
jgi:shikimate dehydrogenase